MKFGYGDQRDDPEYLELRREFIREALGRTGEMRDLLRAAGTAMPRESPGLRFRKLAHDLRGAGGSYGFPIITLYAGEVEDTYLDGTHADALGPLVDMLDGAVRQAGALVGVAG